MKPLKNKSLFNSIISISYKYSTLEATVDEGLNESIVCRWMNGFCTKVGAHDMVCDYLKTKNFSYIHYFLFIQLVGCLTVYGVMADQSFVEL